MGNYEHTLHGKWSKPDIPHRGWTCVGLDDLEDKMQLCGMCEGTQIRYVHYMQHPEFSGTLAVGCICAEHMEQDYVWPKKREARLRRIANRRRSWVKRKWRVSRKGNLYIIVDGFILTIFKRAAYIGVSAKNCLSEKTYFSKDMCKDIDEAKMMAFDLLLWAKEHLD